MEEKNNNKSLIIVLIIIAIIIGAIPGFYFGMQQAGKENNKQEKINNTNTKVDSTTNEEKEDKEEKEEQKKESVSINVENDCINSESQCDKNYELTNNDINVTIESLVNSRGTNSYSQIITIGNKTLYKNDVNNGYRKEIIKGIALLDNDILVIDIFAPNDAGPEYVQRDFFNAKLGYEKIKSITSIYDEFKDEITAKEITYSVAEDGCSRTPGKRAYDYYKLSLLENGKYIEEYLKTEYKECGGQS